MCAEICTHTEVVSGKWKVEPERTHTHIPPAVLRDRRRLLHRGPRGSGGERAARGVGQFGAGRLNMMMFMVGHRINLGRGGAGGKGRLSALPELPCRP